MGSDGLCALTTFNTPKLKEIRINQEIDILGVLYAMAMNGEQTVNIEEFYHGNEFIRRDVNQILKMKFEYSM